MANLDINAMENILKTDKNWIFILILFVFGCILYHDVINYDFLLYDDYIYLSALKNNVTGWWNTIHWAVSSIVNANWSPITLLSLALDYKLYNFNAGGYHITNLILHCVNASILFLLIQKLTFQKTHAFLVAAIFLLHPINSEAVSWISERKGLIGATFSLLSILFYRQYSTLDSGKGYYISAFVCYLFALLSKAVFLPIPILYLLIDWYTSEHNKKNFRFKENIKHIFPFLLLAAVIAITTIYTHKTTGVIVSAEFNPIDARLANAVNSYMVYIKQTFYPFDLTAHYRYVLIPFGIVIIDVILILFISLVAFLNRNRRRYILFGILWYTILILPVIGIIQSGFHAHADRYAYLPLIGIYIITIELIAEIIKAIKLNVKISITSIVLILVLFSFITWIQHKTWQNTFTLFKHNHDIDKNNYVANTNLARFFILNNHIEEGLEYYNKTKSFAPYYINMYDVISYDLLHMNKPDAAIAVLHDLINYNKYFTNAYIKIAQIRINQGEYTKAINTLLAARNLNLTDSKLDYLLGYSYYKTHQVELAIEILEKSDRTKIPDSEISLLLQKVRQEISNE